MRTEIFASILALFAVAAAPPPQTIQVDAAKIVWKDAAPTLPAGTKVAVLEGDPKNAGIFTMRLRIPAGSKIAPHWHPRPERVTILSGVVTVGFGDRWNDKEMRSFRSGDFYVNPPESHHFVGFPRTSVIQITGEGPWELNVVK
jgi:mannose-6-phosphate isomerase-like protein (cupin superfamily)